MDLRKLILAHAEKQGTIRSAEIVSKAKLSRTYVHRALKALESEGKLVRMGKANTSRYVLAERRMLDAEKNSIKVFHRIYQRKKLEEHAVLHTIQRETGIFEGLRRIVREILEYAFTEILNNAIEHSRSKSVSVGMQRWNGNIAFVVVDHGIGIFRNIKRTLRLASEQEAIEELMKGKRTTAPKAHSGEGIFFTSKVGDIVDIESFGKRIKFNNLIDDIFLQTVKAMPGTSVTFSIQEHAIRKLRNVFKAYTNEDYEFDTTSITVDLFGQGNEYFSRSQARRIMSGMERFKKVILNLEGVRTVGQAFAHEVFQVWQAQHPQVAIQYRHASHDVDFMLKRAIKY